jgi:hypothetical protein
MDLQKIVLASSSAQLPHGFNEGPTLDVPHRAPKLDYADIRLFVGVINRYPRHSFNPILDGICQVRHHLDSPTEIVTAPLPLDYVLIDLACCDIILSSQCDVEVSLVVA